MDKITIIRWDDYNMQIKFTNELWDIDITWTTIFFTVKQEYWIDADDDTDAVISKNITVHSDPTHWITILELTSADTDVSLWNYTYDFQLKTVWQQIHSTLRWDFVVVQDVTKRTTLPA